MILVDGPLDGEQQCVYQLNTTPGSVLSFNVDNFQVFHPDSDGTLVLDMGIQAQYALVGPGPDPNPGAPNFDTWTASYIFQFVAESYFPPVPPFLPEPPPTPLPDVFVALEADTGMEIDADDPTPGLFMTGETTLEVDGEVTPIQSSVVSMSAITVLTTEQDFRSLAVLTGESDMEVTPDP